MGSLPQIKQVNVEIPADLARRIKSDAAILGVTLNEYGRVAFEAFLANAVAVRRVRLGNAKRKLTGRKLAP